MAIGGILENHGVTGKSVDKLCFFTVLFIEICLFNITKYKFYDSAIADGILINYPEKI